MQNIPFNCAHFSSFGNIFPRSLGLGRLPMVFFLYSLPFSFSSASFSAIIKSWLINSVQVIVMLILIT